MSSIARNTVLSAIVLSAAAGALGCHDPESPAAFLVQGETGINGIAVDEFNVYFIRRDGHLKKVSLDGGKPVELVGGIDNPQDIALDKDNVYWVTSGGHVGRVPKSSSGSPQDVSTLVDGTPGLTGPASIAVTKEEIYYSGGPQLGIKKVVKAGDTPSTVFDGSVVFAYDGGGFLYAASGDGEITAVRTGDNAVVKLTQGAGAHRDARLAADLDYVYWVQSESPADPASQAATGAVLRAKADTGDVLQVAVNQKDPFRVAGDGKDVFWTNGSGSVSMAPVEGSADPYVMSTGPAGDVYVALDATSIYWARTEGGTITVLPKPADLNQ